MTYQETIKDSRDRFEKALHHLQDLLRTIRTSRASPALVDGIRVEYYGVPTPLSQMASISIPEPRQILIKPYDASILKNIEKAIQASNLGLNPSSDGKVLRLILPPLSEERRRALVKVVKEHGEECLISLRNVRRDANKHADAALNAGGLTEDAHADLKEEVQTLLKTYEGKIKDLVDKKTAELMEV